jgi:hypothetical protein
MTNVETTKIELFPTRRDGLPAPFDRNTARQPVLV